MAPTLRRGWKVRVEALDRPLEPGDVILIESLAGHVIHRYLGAVTLGSPPMEHIVHAGDSSVASGLVPLSCVRGRICSVVRPDGQRLLTVPELPRKAQRRFSLFVARWVLYARLRRLADAIPGLPRLLAGRLRILRGPWA
jgi:hypothetical protein